MMCAAIIERDKDKDVKRGRLFSVARYLKKNKTLHVKCKV